MFLNTESVKWLLRRRLLSWKNTTSTFLVIKLENVQQMMAWSPQCCLYFDMEWQPYNKWQIIFVFCSIFINFNIFQNTRNTIFSIKIVSNIILLYNAHVYTCGVVCIIAESTLQCCCAILFIFIVNFCTNYACKTLLLPCSGVKSKKCLKFLNDMLTKLAFGQWQYWHHQSAFSP